MIYRQTGRQKNEQTYSRVNRQKKGQTDRPKQVFIYLIPKFQSLLQKKNFDSNTFSRLIPPPFKSKRFLDLFTIGPLLGHRLRLLNKTNIFFHWEYQSNTQSLQGLACKGSQTNKTFLLQFKPLSIQLECFGATNYFTAQESLPQWSI